MHPLFCEHPYLTEFLTRRALSYYHEGSDMIDIEILKEHDDEDTQA